MSAAPAYGLAEYLRDYGPRPVYHSPTGAAVRCAVRVREPADVDGVSVEAMAWVWVPIIVACAETVSLRDVMWSRRSALRRLVQVAEAVVDEARGHWLDVLDGCGVPDARCPLTGAWVGA